MNIVYKGNLVTNEFNYNFNIYEIKNDLKKFFTKKSNHL